MASYNIRSLEVDQFTINVVDSTDGIKIIFKGLIEMPSPGHLLMPYFEEIHEKIIANGIKIVEIDLTALEFMNSSGIGALIKWFVKLPSLTDKDKYNIRLVYNKNITWQGKGLTVLPKLDQGHITLVEGK